MLCDIRTEGSMRNMKPMQKDEDTSADKVSNVTSYMPIIFMSAHQLGLENDYFWNSELSLAQEESKPLLHCNVGVNDQILSSLYS